MSDSKLDEKFYAASVYDPGDEPSEPPNREYLKDIGLIKNSLTKENKLFERGCFFGPCVRDYFVSNRQSNVPFHILLSNDSPENIK